METFNVMKMKFLRHVKLVPTITAEYIIKNLHCFNYCNLNNRSAKNINQRLANNLTINIFMDSKLLEATNYFMYKKAIF